MEQKQVQRMSMEQSLEIPNEQALDKSVGNLFEEYLSSIGRLAEFDELSQYFRADLDGVGVLNANGFHAKVSEILKMVIKSTQKLKFLPRVAGG